MSQSQLETNIDEILQERINKIIPGNIKAGVTIFGTTGTYTGEQSNNNS